MGTGFEVDASPETVGIVPRAVDHLFRGVRERQEAAREAGQPPADFKISAQFMELYNEEILDLLDQSGVNRVSEVAAYPVCVWGGGGSRAPGKGGGHGGSGPPSGREYRPVECRDDAG